MARDIFEDIAARHLASQPGIFIKRNHNPGDKAWVAEIDILGIDLINRVVLVVEVKSGSTNDLIRNLDKFEGEMIDRLRLQMRSFGAQCGIDFDTWKYRPLFYVKSSFAAILEKAIGTRSGWNVKRLEDALMLDSAETLDPA